MGKTIQMIAVMMLNIKRRTLIVLPPILISQWESEIHKYTGHRSTVYYGKKRNLISIEESIIVITSYETLLRDKKLEQITWDRIICDEAHHLRNPKTKVFLKMKSLNTSVIWCLTGTPIHNTPKDMFTLFSLYHISSSEFAEMKRRFLCRTKESVGIDIPKKVEIKNMVEWDYDSERVLATDIHSMVPCLKFEHSMEDTFWKKRHYPVLVSMIRAKQTCVLPSLVESSCTTEEDDDEPIPSTYLQVFRREFSSKIKEVICHLTNRISNGNGKIVFCHFRKEMRLIQTALLQLNSASQKIWVGGLKEYQRLFDKNAKPNIGASPILLLQIQSGCEGLNLQERFSEVYFVSPHWNPTLEDQAIARCHRIGQTKTVNVFRFYMNFVEAPDKNHKRNRDIQTFEWICRNIPTDVLRYVNSYLYINNDLPEEDPYSHNYSIDQYTLQKQSAKKQFFKTILEKIL